jgi:D-glycero-D-manno-heptose 1,7-bisphosphate phosphatase
MGIGSSVSARALFLDRDGVVNRAIVRNRRPYPPSSVRELAILPNVPEALARLRSAGIRAIVVTNQPDVARGTIPRAVVEEIHGTLMAQLPLDAIRSCFHDSGDGCACRKPSPGLLLDAAREFDIDLKRSWMVGDRWRDIEAGRAAGCRTMFIDYGYDEKQPTEVDHRVGSLLEAVDFILREPT